MRLSNISNYRDEVDTPALFIDLEKLESNIKKGSGSFQGKLL